MQGNLQVAKYKQSCQMWVWRLYDMLQPGGEGGTVHYQQFFGSICSSQTLTWDEFQANTAYGPEIWYSVAYTACWPPQACEPGDRTGLEERNSARLTHMLLPTGNPSDLSGKLQGENITVQHLNHIL